MRYGLILTLVLAIAAPASAAKVHWYLGAAMSKPGQELTQAYNEQEHPHKLVLVTGGSGQLLSKIRATGKGDLYTPTSSHFLEQARLYGVVAHSRPLLQQWPVFGLAPAIAPRVESLKNLARPGCRLALGNRDTMALGRVFQEIAARMPSDLSQALQANTKVRSVHIQQTVSYLQQGVVDAGLIFDSVAQAHNLAFVPIPQRWNQPVRSFLVELQGSNNPQAAQEVADYIRRHANIFSDYGFEVLPWDG